MFLFSCSFNNEKNINIKENESIYYINNKDGLKLNSQFKKTTSAKPKVEQVSEAPIKENEDVYSSARNYIITGDIQEAINVLTLENINTLESPEKAVLWLFLCKCKLGKKDEADVIIRDYFDSLSIQEDVKETIYSVIEFYSGIANDRSILMTSENSDPLDKCMICYYYGAYKKYYNGDLISANRYFRKALSTNMSSYSEYMFSEVEIKGYTRIRTILEKTTATDDANAQITTDQGIEDLIKEKKEYINIPAELTGGEYAIPALNGAGWEICTKEEVIKSLKKEVMYVIMNLPGGNKYFKINNIRNKRYYVLDNEIEQITYDYSESMGKGDVLENEYGVTKALLDNYIGNGGFISCARIHVNVYNQLKENLEGTGIVAISCFFSVDSNRKVKLIKTIFNVL